ncbi:DUF433 domain-containing protein [Flavobacterium sp.]|uniref:DUF433 domain-containing protein n=1 Tax=Flavobacterium sp. TaxID=239 RepID=UPI002488062C|nr:DUF433 domain-containing protein [Flavobacterium sp.]MDI1317021.1 DUF433 domain-containing protein [Flavobacterium sp.]
MINYREHIVLNTEIRFGKPTIKGTRITVYDVLNWLANGKTIEEIVFDFPELSPDAIKSCLAYAAEKEHKIRVAS